MINKVSLILLLPLFFLLLPPLSGVSESALIDDNKIVDWEIRQKIENVTNVIDSGELKKEDLSVAYQYRGILYSDLYLLGEASRDLKKSVEIDPNNINAYVDLGIIYMKFGDYNAAIGYCEEAISLDNKNDYAYENKGYAIFYSNKYEEAFKIFQHCLNLDPTDKYRFLWEFISCERSGRSGKDILRKRLEGTQSNEWPENLIKLFLDEIKPEAVLNNPKIAKPMTNIQAECEAFFFIGQYFILKGDLSKAREYFQKSVATEVKEFLEYLFSRKELERLSN